MVCHRIHESLEGHHVKSEFNVGSVPNMHRISSGFKSMHVTKNMNTQYPHGHPKHRGF